MTYTPIEGVKVIGLTGAARAGKDTLARALMGTLPGAERFGFSDAIAAYARASGAMTARDPRVLQDVGWRRRQEQPTVWIDALYGAIVDKAPAYAIVTGVRFLDEADLIRRMGGVLVRVTRVEQNGASFTSDDRDASHAVEREIDQIRPDREVVIPSGELGAFTRASNWIASWLGSGFSRNCQTCYWFKRRSLEYGTCYQDARRGASVPTDGCCEHHTPTAMHVWRAS